MHLKSSSFDIFVAYDRIIQESEKEIILILPFPNLPEMIIQKLKEASNRGVRIILIHGDYFKNLSIFREIETMQYFSLRNLHSKMVISEKALMMGSSNLSPSDPSREMAIYLDSNSEWFTKITEETKELLAEAMTKAPVMPKAPQSVEQDSLGRMLKQILENQKNELKSQIMMEMYQLISSAMETMLTKFDVVESEVKESKELLLETQDIVRENYELTHEIRTELLAILPDFQKTMNDWRTHLHSKFEDLDTIYDELSDKITEEIKKVQIKIDKQNYEKAEQYLEEFLGGCWSYINLESRNFLITSEVVFHAMKELKELDFSPALIPMTKALESILNQTIFEKIVHSITPREMNDRNRFRNIRLKHGPNAGAMIKHATLGDVIYMFKDRDVLQVMNRIGIFKQEITSDPYFNRDDRYMNNVLNIAPTTFIGKLNLIREKYRNKVAHQDGISRTTAEECRQYMIFGEAFIKEFMDKLRIEQFSTS